MKVVIDAALATIPAERLWINPDSGLKTRQWGKTKEALTEMVKLAQIVRAQFV